ncbi:GNAT family N-acetyltransferase [Vannielia litorea]|uniref:Predicted N-acyltransferase, GNAT family n=1 Tax=Vannielia litorea TaxID=1217970 RepID=A0A1N6IEY3_9RHOB|nr:GNAT family N-acetyltransferase [Vannielia litorea]SIO30596.1 Predicted N-acyltransferase, GNAT family [Vannielia litorea]
MPAVTPAGLTIAVTDDFAACMSVRIAVFVNEQGVPAELENDEHDAEALHLLATRGTRPVGTARVMREGATGKIGRVCVLPELRGTGLGLALMEAALSELRNMEGIERVILGAQTSALPFYARLGFAPYGAPFDSVGIPHVMMARLL